jgi:hypothetical protein
MLCWTETRNYFVVFQSNKHTKNLLYKYMYFYMHFSELLSRPHRDSIPGCNISAHYDVEKLCVP